MVLALTKLFADIDRDDTIWSAGGVTACRLEAELHRDRRLWDERQPD